MAGLRSALAAVSPIQALHSWQSKNLVDTGTVLSEVEGTFSLLDANHGGRGRAAARGAVVDALRRRLEAVVPNLGYNVRVSLIESSWAFSCLPELHPVTVTLTETWPGEMPANMACALHKWPEDAFMRLPKVVRWKCCMVIPERFRMILASLVERWFSSVAPGVRKNLFVASRSTTSRGGSAARRAADPHLYSALGDLVGHTEGTLLNSFAVLAWRGLKHDVTRGRSSLYPILFIDVVLSLKVPAAGLARRVATVLDGAVSRGAWDDAAISRLKSILNGEKSPTLACGQFQTSLEHCWMQLKKTDTSNLFALPVTDNVVTGYSAVIRQPMDLSIVRSKISCAQQSYHRLAAFEQDVKLMVENCKLFNGTKSTYADAADLVWDSWLQCKAREQLRDDNMTTTRAVAFAGSPAGCSQDFQQLSCFTESKISHMFPALVLSEPQCAAIASYELCNELELCLNLQMIPNKRPRIPELYRVLTLHLASRRALGIQVESAQQVIMDLRIDAPRLLACLGRFTYQQACPGAGVRTLDLLGLIPSRSKSGIISDHSQTQFCRPSATITSPGVFKSSFVGLGVNSQQIAATFYALNQGGADGK